MKKTHFTLLLFGLAFLLTGFSGCERESPSPPDKPQPFVRLLKKRTLQSNLLQGSINYAVLLPRDYDSSKASYPVVYLLHGMGDDETAWYDGGEISYYVDILSSGTVPMIYVMPQGFNTYWVNKYDGSYPYMNMLVKEMVPTIDRLFRTIKDPQHRAVMGYSMGGYGALILPAKNPDIFKTGVILSMSYRTDPQYMSESQSGWNSQWGSVFGGIGASGTARLTEYYKSNNPFYFFKNTGDVSLSGQNYFFDCGDDEENLSEPNDALHDMLRGLNIKHEYRVRNGEHNWDYWHASLPEALKFISLAVQNIPYPDASVPADPGPAVPAERTVTEHLEGSELKFSVTMPTSYPSGTISYPLIIALHDRDAAFQDKQSEQLISILSTNMNSNKLPASLIVEIPIQTGTIDAKALQQIIDQVRLKYRTLNNRVNTIILGNSKAGGLAYELIPKLRGSVSACLLFDADLPENANSDISDVSYYLDISDEGVNCKNYHTLYMNLRNNHILHEYRVRQDTPSHESFLNGLNESISFIFNLLTS